MKKEEKAKTKFYNLIRQSDIPLIVYVAVFLGIVISWSLKQYQPDLSLNLFSELLGAAFTLFVIDVLLVRSKSKRWQIVQEHINYLIARDVNRIRDGIATRAFSFDPQIKMGLSTQDQLIALSQQRADFFLGLASKNNEEIRNQISNNHFFSNENYSYFNEKAEEIWSILNMKYSEYMAPELVADLMRLHTNLKDICSHIRQYQKGDRFPDDKSYYHEVGNKGIALSLKQIIILLNDLKEKGYSLAARVTNQELNQQ